MFNNLSFEYSAGIGATLLSGEAAPWAITTGMQLQVSVGGTVETWTFTAGDGASAATLVAAIDAQAQLVDATNDGGSLRLTSLAPGSQAELVVLGGTANSVLLFPSAPQYGVTYFGAPWGWSTVVLYTGKAVRETFTDDVDPTRELFGLAWFPASALSYDQVIFTDNGAPSFFEKFRVYETGWASEVNSVLPALPVAFTQNDPESSADTEQFQAYEVGWLLAASDGVFGASTAAEPEGELSDGTFESLEFAGDARPVEDFYRVIGGERYGVPEATGDTVLVVGAETYTVKEDDVPGGLSTLENQAFRSHLMAAKVNAHDQNVWVVAQQHPVFPEVGIYLYPLVPLAQIYELGIELDGVAMPNPVDFDDFNRTTWFWEDYFPPTTTFAR